MAVSDILTVITLLFTLQTTVFAGDYSPSGKFKSCSTNTKVKPGEFVDLHNKARKSVGASSVSWDQGLANVAQCWANRCVFEHSHTPGMGENIAAGSGPYSDQNAFVDWWEEFKLYHKGEDFSEGTGHYTQVAWTGTKKIGCGVSICPSSQLGLGGTYNQARFVVCEYFPPGNVIGTFNNHVNMPSYDPMAHMGDRYGQDDYSNKFNDDTTTSTPRQVNVPKINKTTGNTGTKTPTTQPSSNKNTGTTTGTNTTITGGGGKGTSKNQTPNNGSGSSTCDPNGSDNYSSDDDCTPPKPSRKHKHNHHGHKGGHHKPMANSRHSTNSGSGGSSPAPTPQNADDYQPSSSSQDSSDDSQSPKQSTNNDTKGSTDSQTPTSTDYGSADDSQSPTSSNDTQNGSDYSADGDQNTDASTQDYQSPPIQDDEQSGQPAAVNQGDDGDDYSGDGDYGDDYGQSSQDDDDDNNNGSGNGLSISIGL
ncbi:hypothetical protein L7F22_068184 [Adiantum nelumboides]|nr:hypothetical protein [Adiantum nelumboides]